MKSRTAWGDVLESLGGEAGAPRDPRVLATVLHTRGSAPLPRGSQAVVVGGALVAGTVGGGALEAETLQRAARAAATGLPEVFEFPLSGLGGGSPDPVCGGTVSVLVQPLSDRIRLPFQSAWQAWQKRGSGVIESRLHEGPPPEVHTRWWSAGEIGSTAGRGGGERHQLQESLALGAPRVLPLPSPDEGGQHRSASQWCVLHLPVRPRPQLLIAGAGHVGQALAAQAALLDFSVTVVDDRPEYLAPSHFPEGTGLVCGPVGDAVASFPVDAETYIALVTRGYLLDAEALAACLHRPAAYIGMIGSRRKVALVREHFINSGLAEPAALDRVHAPIGIDIAAETAPEIAVSILAQIVALRRRRGAGRHVASSHHQPAPTPLAAP